MALVVEESKRIKQFRLEIARQIPKFPNDRDTLELLQQKSLGSLLIDYANWVSRYVPPRPRAVSIEPAVTADPRWKRLAADTKALLEKARAGIDLTPHLSSRVRREGFTPAAASIGPDADRWADKDFLLNVMGYHHFHLSQTIEPSGEVTRTDDVLFAQVTRDRFTAVGFFDHSVFESVPEPGGKMSAERGRLWKIFDERNSAGLTPGTVYISGLITTSGHPLHHSSIAGEYARLVAGIDPQLDDLSFRAKFFDCTEPESAKSLKPSWCLSFLDLGIFEKKSSAFFLLRKGPF